MCSSETAITYPEVYVQEMTGAQIKAMMEDICDNLFNPDPYYQQGGDMVRIGGMDYACTPAETVGKRISDMALDSGKPVDADKTYRVAGWASVNPQQGKPVLGRGGELSARAEDREAGAIQPGRRQRHQRESRHGRVEVKTTAPTRRLAGRTFDMTALMRALAVAAALVAGIVVTVPAEAAGKTHRIVFQIDQNDPALMNLVLNNVDNVMAYYHDKGEQAEIEVVAYGPGLHMLRADTSPVKDRLKRLKQDSFPSRVTLSACGNTMTGMEKKEGHPIAIVPEASIVPAGVVRITELQEAGWSYIRP